VATFDRHAGIAGHTAAYQQSFAAIRTKAAIS
jgi:hypothetical protein